MFEIAIFEGLLRFEYW